MSDHIQKTLTDVQRNIAEMERELAKKKELANHLAEMSNLPIPYSIVNPTDPGPSAVVARDAFVGEPLHSAMRMYLDTRKVALPTSAPATVNEIFAGLLEGGYTFETKNEENAKRIIRITLTKNSNTFHKVGNAYGLVAWYGPKVQKKVRRPGPWLAQEEGESSAEQESREDKEE